MLKILNLTLIILSGSFNLIAQTEYEEKLNRYLDNQMQEKVYLHLDKPHYGAGDKSGSKPTLLTVPIILLLQ